jgi:glycosyltransferase involved in cell wall biosynthesis
MKVLWVKAGGLVPPDTGGRIRSYSILRELARQHSVTFFSFYAAHDNDAHSELERIFAQVVCVPLRLPAPKSASEIFEYGVRLFSPDPYGITKYCRPAVRRRLHNLGQEVEYDVILCDFVAAAGVIPWNSHIPKVLFTHNVEAMIWRRHYEVAANPVWKAISLREWRKMEAAELRYLRLADRVLTVSETDREAFATFLEPAKLTVIPTGVDVEYFLPNRSQPEPIITLQQRSQFYGSTSMRSSCTNRASGVFVLIHSLISNRGRYVARRRAARILIFSGFDINSYPRWRNALPTNASKSEICSGDILFFHRATGLNVPSDSPEKEELGSLTDPIPAR